MHKHSPASIIDRLIPSRLAALSTSQAFAPSNIALCKYWGKRDSVLNLPTNASLSISLGNLGTTTTLSHADSECDQVLLNGRQVPGNTTFAQKVSAFIDLFRRDQHLPLVIDTVNTIPTAAGLASSASGFAALTLALNDFLQLSLPPEQLSAIARMGSGSASRSLYQGFVHWHKGVQENGMDSCAHHITCNHSYWKHLCVGIVTVSSAAKKINSRDGMNRTVATSSLYEQWPQQAARDLNLLRQAIDTDDFVLLGETAEHNALSMHATMISAWPPVLYWQPQSVAIMHRVWELRENGIPVYFTMDAGPNIKLLFEEHHRSDIESVFADITIVTPFSQ